MASQAAADPTLWGADGPVAKASQALSRPYAAREGQAELASVIKEALSRQSQQPVGLVTVEAATGTGKTLGYLVPGMLHAAATQTRMLVSTHTVELGRQLVTDDGPLAAEVAAQLGHVRPAIAQMRGHRHFLSPSRTRAAGRMLREAGHRTSVWSPYFDAADLAAKAAARASAAMHEKTVDASIIDEALTNQIEQDLGMSFDREDVCLLRSSPDDEKAVLRLAKRLASKADVLITTHAYTATCLAWRNLFQADEDPFSLLVIDEADRWANAAESVSLLEVSLDSLQQSVSALAAAARYEPRGASLTASAERVAEMVKRLSDSGPTQPSARIPIAVTDNAMKTLVAIGDEIERITDLAAQFRTLTASAAGTLSEHRLDITRMSNALSRNDTGFWTARWTTSRVTARPSISVAGRMPSRIMRRLWTQGEGRQPLARTILLTSATLKTPGFSPGARWKSLEIATGFDTPPGMLLTDLTRIIEPTHFGKMRVRFADPRAPIPSVAPDGLIDGEALAYITEVVKAAMVSARRRQGRTLVLVPSYATAAQLEGIDGLTVHRQGQPIREMLAEYKRQPGACLVTPAAWIGVNLPGMIQELVIPRIPFVPSEENAPNGARLMAETLMKLQQGIGRGIRAASDDVTLWIADPRMPPPECVIEETGLLRHRSSQPVLLTTIPERFRARFGVDADAAGIAVKIDKQPMAAGQSRPRARKGRTS